MKKIVIIILNWNGADDTLACLNSLLALKGSFHALVVDNGSSDDSVERIGQWIGVHNGEISCEILPLDKNYGFAIGNNKGIAYARKYNPDYYLLLNNDTEVTPDFLTKLVTFSQCNPDYRVLTPKIHFFYDKEKIWNCGGKLSLGFRKYYYAGQTDADIKEKEYIPIGFVTGCALFFSPELLDADGRLLTERFFFGEEDFEFSMRMQAEGVKMACVLDSVIYHKVGAATNKNMLPGKTYIYYLNRFINVRQHYGKLFFSVWSSLYRPYIVRTLIKSGCPKCLVSGFIKRLYAEAKIKESVTFDDFTSALNSGWAQIPTERKKRIMILSDSSSDHTKRWVKAIAESGYDVALFSLNNKDYDYYSKIDNVKLYFYDIFGKIKAQRKNGHFEKISYLKPIFNLRRHISEFKPDIVHAHYATSYGMLGVLSGFHPLIVSLWGSDAYIFPKVSFIHRNLFEFNLSKADKILSTSCCMAREVAQYTKKEITVTPFGVDVDKFKPKSEIAQKDVITIGTVKTLSYIYGIDTLIDAFAIVVDKCRHLDLRLNIAGDGMELENLKAQTERLSLTDKVNFLGRIPNDSVPEFLSQLDVYVALSRSDSESFGVAVVEAMSCAVPVVVADADGFKEVVPDGVAGYVVPKNNAQAAAERIMEIISDKKLAAEMGQAGRRHVLENYTFKSSVDIMKSVYNLLS